MLLRIVIGIPLVIHGVAHVDNTRVWDSRSSASSWLPGEAEALGTVLSLLALAGGLALKRRGERETERRVSAAVR